MAFCRKCLKGTKAVPAGVDTVLQSLLALRTFMQDAAFPLGGGPVCGEGVWKLG